MIPYIPTGIHPPLQQQYLKYSNIIKTFANQNVCYTCGFDVEDWHTSTTCNRKKLGQEFVHANHPFCRKAVHKNYVFQQLLTVLGGEYRC